MTEVLTAETFTPQLGGEVSLASGHKLTLIAVDRHKSHRPDAVPGAAFTLILRGAPAPIAPEGMHRLTFADGASFELYIIPVHTPSRGHQDYQVVFN